MTWTVNRATKVWSCSSYSDLNYAEINNFAEYGQPKSPYEPGYDHDFIPDFANIVIQMTQLEVMTNGYGRNVRVDSFKVAKDFLSRKISVNNGTYSFDQLVTAGLASSGDRWINSNLYGWGGYSVSAGSISSGDAAYIHGTVSLALMRNTRFVATTSGRRVEAELGAGDDNWDFNSSSIPNVVNAVVGTLLGPAHYNLEGPIQIKFTGAGRTAIAES